MKGAFHENTQCGGHYGKWKLEGVVTLYHLALVICAFINTELYARVSVAVLFYKLADLADMLGSIQENGVCHAALESGKLFLLELLDSVWRCASMPLLPNSSVALKNVSRQEPGSGNTKHLVVYLFRRHYHQTGPYLKVTNGICMRAAAPIVVAHVQDPSG
ncbi:hypothetical protein HHK36_028618 [Tetracentron sinense]|uniref:Uncharacterized protein n=1 Tax=Tetracentron sinense TaxID=13715 RepID=A0A834YDG8_TETSI|nr:hypothetical protein HHK36_028618 [Tetracentron sinense]